MLDDHSVQDTEHYQLKFQHQIYETVRHIAGWSQLHLQGV